MKKKINIAKQLFVTAACICLGGVLGGVYSDGGIVRAESAYDTGFVTSTSGAYQYQVVDEQEKTATIRRILTSAEAVTVPAQLDGYSVIGVGDITGCLSGEQTKGVASECYMGASEEKVLESITFPDSVRYIGAYAFANYESLEQVVFSPKTRMIDSYAFCGCRNLREIELTEGIKYGEDAFANIGVDRLCLFDRVVMHGQALSGNYSVLGKRAKIDTLVIEGRGKSVKKYGCEFCRTGKYTVNNLIIGENIKEFCLGTCKNGKAYEFEWIQNLYVKGKKTMPCLTFSKQKNITGNENHIQKMYVLSDAKAALFAKKYQIANETVTTKKMNNSIQKKLRTAREKTQKRKEKEAVKGNVEQVIS